jgi:uncharacterized protein YndB with AHSA1/START domain
MTTSRRPFPVTDPPATRTVEREVTIAADAAAVWKALTEADELVRWFPLDARVKPGAGGSVWMSWQELYEGESEIDIWEPERHLRLRFPRHGPLVMATDYHLQARGGSTVLRVVTSGFGSGADWDVMYGGVSRGWDFELISLAHYLERHPGVDRRVAWARATVAGPASQAWDRLVGPGRWLEPRTGTLAAGDRIALPTPRGALTGSLRHVDPPWQIVAIVPELADALLRLEIEGQEGRHAAVAWLSAWDGDAEVVGAIEQHWRAELPRLLGNESNPSSR